MKRLFTTEAILLDTGLALVRIIVGLFLLYHGWEVFDAAKMKEYASWDVFRQASSPIFMVYLGKGSEFLTGILLTMGLLTRIGCLIVIGTMVYIAFCIGNGKIWYEDQHPFLFVLLALVFLFTGPGKWSVDALLEKQYLKRDE
ncbi:DoxX family protein [Spirosoma linguale]|uniref:DoxX family protein n=1 Tax=Spirosoma linguale (strain ATCC 33905 / DSM 74 / LMG 10896 / Claus 1) TaxID=504472 RepID=D2QJ20_SPILD|nr:DoxX family protein [Spirosoma linguale DSM 74]